MPCHRGECFPIDAFLVDAKSAPSRFILKYLMRELIDARACLAGTGVARYEPSSAELVTLPIQPAKTCNPIGAFARKKKPHRDQHENSTGHYEKRARGLEHLDPIGLKLKWTKGKKIQPHKNALPSM